MLLLTKFMDMDPDPDVHWDFRLYPDPQKKKKKMRIRTQQCWQLTPVLIEFNILHSFISEMRRDLLITYLVILLFIYDSE